jgi:hypothetical protein
MPQLDIHRFPIEVADISERFNCLHCFAPTNSTIFNPEIDPDQSPPVTGEL